MKLISHTPLLSPIIDELLNILYTKLARVISSFSFCTTRIGFCSGFYPARIVKCKVGVIWVRYFIVDHAHPTLEFGYWENICTCQSTNLLACPIFNSTINETYTREGSSYHQASFLVANFWYGPFLTTRHLLEDSSFSSIPSTYNQHTKPIAQSSEILG